MSALIGRLPLAGPVEVHTIGTGAVEVSGFVDAGSSVAAMHLASALAALVDNPDEPVVPVVVTDGWAGFGRITAASFDPLRMTAGQGRYSVTVEPVGSSITSALTATVRQNAHSLLVAAPIHAVPSASSTWSWLPTQTAQQEVRATAPGPAGGGVSYRRVATGTGSTIATWSTPPESYFAGGCAVEQRVGGSWLPVVGRARLTGPWRVTNGLVRWTLNEAGRLAVEWWRPDGAGWTPTVEFGIGQGGGVDYSAWVEVEVTSLSAHAVTVRAQGVRAQGRATLWLTLRRGSRVIGGTADTDALPGHRVRPVPAAAVTDAGSHAHLPGDIPDSGGCRWLITAADDFAVATATGIVTPANVFAGSWSWGLGAWFEGAAGDTGNRLQTALDWFVSQSESVGFR